MARISKLFSLPFYLALGYLFLSVSGHAPPAPLRKLSYPKTVSELQILPFTEMTEILNQKEQFTPKTVEFKVMFKMCKCYIAYLESLYKLENPIVDVLGISKAKYALMTKAIIAVQASLTGKVDKKTSLNLRKSYADLTKGFLQIQKMIIKISAKHNFKANAMINFRESKKIGDGMINFKNSINAFMDVVYDLEKKKMKKVGHHIRILKEGEDSDRYGNSFERFFYRFGGYLGGNTHGRELTEAHVGVNVEAHADGKIKFVGEDGFRSLNRPQYKHFFSSKA